MHVSGSVSSGAGHKLRTAVGEVPVAVGAAMLPAVMAYGDDLPDEGTPLFWLLWLLLAVLFSGVVFWRHLVTSVALTSDGVVSVRNPWRSYELVAAEFDIEYGRICGLTRCHCLVRFVPHRRVTVVALRWSDEDVLIRRLSALRAGG